MTRVFVINIVRISISLKTNIEIEILNKMMSGPVRNGSLSKSLSKISQTDSAEMADIDSIDSQGSLTFENMPRLSAIHKAIK